MELYKCPCVLDAVCVTENPGFIKVTSNGNNGDVKGIYKSDVNIKGMRFATGLTWYAGNYEIGGLVQRDEEYLEIVRMDAVDFFDNVDVENGNIALLCAVSINEYDVYIAAVAYMGSGSFYFASNIINVAQVWKDSDIILPDKDNSCISSDTIDLSDKVYAKFIKVNSSRIITNTDSARKDLFKVVKTDLKRLKVKVPGEGIDIMEAYSATLDKVLFITTQGIYENDTKISDLVFQIDQKKKDSNIFSNYIFTCWSVKSYYCGLECVKLDNGQYKLSIPKRNGHLYISGLVENKPHTFIYDSKTDLNIKEDKWTDYFLVTTLGKDKKIMVNSINKNLIEYKDFVVPIIPKNTLVFQDIEIDGIIGISKIIQYTKD